MPANYSYKIKSFQSILQNSYPYLKNKYNIKNMEVFGSYVRGEDNDQSDLDILIEFSDETGLGLLEFIRLENELGELFQVKVDLVMKDSLKDRLKSNILKETISLI